MNAPEMPASPAPQLRDQLHVLLVEDNPGDVVLFRSLVEESPHKALWIEHVTTLRAAIDKLQRVHFDAIITDLHLPDSDGTATLRELSVAVPDVPLIVLTHCDDDPFALELLKNGAQDYLVKGQSDGPLILKTIRYAIERKESDQHFAFL